MRILYNADDNISDLLWELVNLNDSLNPIDHHTLAHSIEGLAKISKDGNMLYSSYFTRN